MLVDLRILMLLALAIGIPKRFVIPRFMLVGAIVVMCKGYMGDLTLTLATYVLGLILGNSMRRYYGKFRSKKNELV